MGKKRVAWNKIHTTNLPGFSCQHCHGEGKVLRWELNEEGKEVTYYAYCTCYQGRRLKKANQNLVLR